MDRLTRVGNPRFFNRTGPHPLAKVAAAAGCTPPTCDVLVSGLASLALAGPDEVSFADSRRHDAALAQTRAGAVLVDTNTLPSVPSGTVPLITSDPMAGWAQIAALFHPMPCINPGIHSSAVVADDAHVDATAEVCAQAVIEAHADIGPRCKIGPGAVIGNGVVLGPDCRIGPHVTISHALLGARVYVYPGARIGQEGFGFTITPRGFQTVPQLGCVIIEDDVEVGANTSIDRGSLGDTVIGTGTRLDNLVQIAHNVRIGRHCAIAALVGISGSAEIGDFVVVGGQAGFANRVHVGARSRVGAQSGVMSDLDPGAVVIGSPARPAREMFREIATLKKLARAGRS
ncbi:MAG: UDP-3-O-(3-hydroxymyristoyl)glucosamine N-acyltransferase [Pseudomonadota bacterium]|nr:UDP-3-O-(3-hydroxymyristoyl)glucosamine N-acyltransferase [Pseudomonadota bacterium]